VQFCCCCELAPVFSTGGGRGGCSYLIVVLSILINFVVFIVFLFSKMDLDQHAYLNYCLGTIGC